MTWCKPILFFLILAGLSLGGSSVCAQNLRNALQDIQLISLEKVERIELLFEKNYTETPIIDFDAGFIFLRLNATSIGTPARQFAFSESSPLIKSVRATQNQNSTLVEIIFHSSNLSLENTVYLTMNGQKLWIDLNRQKIQSQTIEVPVQDNLSEEVEQRLREGEQLSPPEAEPADAVFIKEEPAIIAPLEENWMMTSITLILSLMFLFLLLFVFLYLYKRVFSGRFPALEGKFKIRTVSTFHIGSKQKVVVLEVNGQHFACGVTANHISFLTEVRGAQDQAFLQDVAVVDDEIDFNANQARADFLKTLETARKKSQQMKPPPEPPAPQSPAASTFAETLHQETTKVSAPPSPPKPTESPRPSSAASSKPARKPGKAPSKSFDTPVFSETENTVLAGQFENDASLQQFAKKLSQRLKMLKPIE